MACDFEIVQEEFSEEVHAVFLLILTIWKIDSTSEFSLRQTFRSSGNKIFAGTLPAQVKTS